MQTKNKIYVVTAHYEYNGFVHSKEILGAYWNISDAFSNLRKYDYKLWFMENVSDHVIFEELQEEVCDDGTYRAHTNVRHALIEHFGDSVWLTITPTELVEYKF